MIINSNPRKLYITQSYNFAILAQTGPSITPETINITDLVIF